MLREYYEHMTHALMHIPDMGEEISSVASRMSTWLLWMHPMLLLAVDTSYMYMLVQISIGSRIYTIRLLWRSYSLALRLCVVYMNRIQQFPQTENNDYLSAHYYRMDLLSRTVTAFSPGYHAGTTIPGLKVPPLVSGHRAGTKEEPLVPVGVTNRD